MGWQQNFVNWNKMTFGDMIDPAAGFIYQTGSLPSGSVLENGWATKGLLDINTGIALISDSFNAGFSVNHVNRPNHSQLNATARLPMLFIGHVNSSHQITSNFMLEPSGLYTLKSGFHSFIAGMRSKYKIFTLGAWLRETHALIFSSGIEKSRFRIQYSYEFNIRPVLVAARPNALEGSLMLFF